MKNRSLHPPPHSTPAEFKPTKTLATEVGGTGKGTGSGAGQIWALLVRVTTNGCPGANRLSDSQFSHLYSRAIKSLYLYFTDCCAE